MSSPADSSRGLLERFLQGDRRALARLCSLVENESPVGLEALDRVASRTGRSRILGITGPPGAGKSTLVDRLGRELRRQGRTLGIVAVDPTSPFSGGAILGDRIRMAELAEDREVFIRSMGTRGALGGLALATENVVRLLDAFGKDVVLVETVGVGQAEVDIAKSADTTLVVEVPGLGDGIQAIKAGILEIGDLFVVNKSDREGADRVVAEIQAMLETCPAPLPRIPPVLKTVAATGEGIPAVLAAVEDHWAWLLAGDRFGARRAQRRECQLRRVLAKRLMERFEAAAGADLGGLLAEVRAGSLGPWEAAGRALDRVLGPR